MCHIGVFMGECNGVQPLMRYIANLERSILATRAGIYISKFLDARFSGYDEGQLLRYLFDRITPRGRHVLT